MSASEEKNGVKSSELTEMAPQDGTKVPLADSKVEVKFTAVASPNGDAQVDVGAAPTFTGLSKEELMKYSDDPFWVRLRWFLFILFWLGWLAMLVMAIVIIIQAPRCDPPPTLLKVQESPMIEYDLNADGASDGVKALTEMLGMESIYLPGLISSTNFSQYSSKYIESEVEVLLKTANDASIYVVTDFVSSLVSPDHVWLENLNNSDYFLPGENIELNFASEGLIIELEVIFKEWVDKGVSSFLIDTRENESLQKAKVNITEAVQMVNEESSVVSGVTDMQGLLSQNFDALMYRGFLEKNANDIELWSYFKFDPIKAQVSVSNDFIRLITMSLMLVPGTPILQSIQNKDYINMTANSLIQLTDIRNKNAIKFGSIEFANTSRDVVAYVRVMKGNPGYAVAINVDEERNATVNFVGLVSVPDSKADIIFSSPGAYEIARSGRVDLKDVFLSPFEGIVLQFVPN